MRQGNFILAGILIVVFGLFMVQVQAGEPMDKPMKPTKMHFNLEAVTCWEVITLPDDSETSVLLLLYGYHAGQQGKSNMSSGLIEQSLVNLVDYCEEHPDMAAVKAIKAAQ